MSLTELEGINRDTGESVKVLLEKNCCIEHDGEKYCSGGASIYPDFMTAYTDLTEKLEVKITTWSGEIISDTSFYGGKHPWGYTYVHFIYDGSWWTGREIAQGNLMYAKRTKESA